MTGKLVPICKWEAKPVFSEEELNGQILSTNGPSFVGVLEVTVPFTRINDVINSWSTSSISKRHELEIHVEPRWIAPQDPRFTVRARSHTHKVALDLREFHEVFSPYGNVY